KGNSLLGPERDGHVERVAHLEPGEARGRNRDGRAGDVAGPADALVASHREEQDADQARAERLRRGGMSVHLHSPHGPSERRTLQSTGARPPDELRARTTRTVVPRSCSLSAAIVPPCDSTNAFA